MVNVYRNKNSSQVKKITVKNIKQLCLINDLNVYVFIITSGIEMIYVLKFILCLHHYYLYYCPNIRNKDLQPKWLKYIPNQQQVLG